MRKGRGERQSKDNKRKSRLKKIVFGKESLKEIRTVHLAPRCRLYRGFGNVVAAHQEGGQEVENGTAHSGRLPEDGVTVRERELAGQVRGRHCLSPLRQEVGHFFKDVENRTQR